MLIYRLMVWLDRLVTKLDEFLRFDLNLHHRNKFYLFVSRIGRKITDCRRYVKIHFLPLACPKVWGFIAYKVLCEDKIAKLYIPAHAKRSSADENKCRASEAIVLEIYSYQTAFWLRRFELIQVNEKEWYSMRDSDFKYEVWKIVTPTEPFNEDRWIECAPWIHFFMTEKEALDCSK